MANIGNKSRISKEEMFMQIAEVIAKRSTCKRLHVGAVITDGELKIIKSYGYNGNYSGGPNTCDTTQPGACGCIHAELNSLTKPHNRLDSDCIFITDSPCTSCAKNIVNSGIKNVFYRKKYRLDEGILLLEGAGIKVKQI